MLLTYTTTFPGTCSSLQVLTFEFVHLLTRWRNKTTAQHFCSYEQNKRQHISNFSSGTQLPKFKSVNTVFLFLKILRVVSSSEKRKQTTNKQTQQKCKKEAQTQEGKQKRREQAAQRREAGNQEQLGSPPGNPVIESQLLTSQPGLRHKQGRASSGKQKPLLCWQPETSLIALLVLSSSSIGLHISPSQRNVTLV